MTARAGRPLAALAALAAALAAAPSARAQSAPPVPPPADTVGRAPSARPVSARPVPAPPASASPGAALSGADTLRADSLRRLARLDAERSRLAAAAPDPLAPRDVPARRPARALDDAALGSAGAASDAPGAPPADARGTFALRSDAPGFAVGLVRWGLDPAATALVGEDGLVDPRGPGRPAAGWSGGALHGAQSLATGAARWDVVPLSWVARLDWQGATLVAPRRAFDAPRPLTDVRYVTSGPEQRVEATHAQARRRRLAGADGIVRVAVGYAGRAGDGPVANQRLTRGRTLDARLAFDTGRTRAEASITHHRATFGASGGAEPPDASDPYSLFDRLRTLPIDGASTRRRTGTSATLDLARGRTALALGADTDELRYQPGLPAAALDTTTGRVRRLRARLALPLGPVSVASDAALDAGSGAFASAVVSAGARASVGLGRATGARLTLAAGADVQGGAVVPAGRLDGAARVGPVEATGEASQALAPVSQARRDGFGPWLPAGADAALRVRLARVGLAVGRAEGLRTSVDAFASETSGWAAWASPGAPVADRVGADVQRVAGAVGAVGVRDGARRGLYGRAWVQAARGEAPGVPPLHGDARAGVRALLFRGDLDADAFVRLRGWTAFTGRVVHEPTGLLLRPTDASAARVRAGTQLDLVASAHVRTATLHLALVDALAGTLLTRGSLTVPGYPFAGRRLEVAVFWPIFD